MDNITLYGVACGQPNNLTATNITAETATLSWSENGSATSWTVFYKPVNSTGAYSEEEVSDTPSIDLAGLLANTNYVFYVVSHCTEAESNPSVSYTFRTGCGPISILPYFEDFETGLYNTLQNQYIVCWDRLSTNSAPYPYIGNYYSYSHSNSHYLDFNYTPNCSNIAIMPALDSTLNAGDLMVTLYACHTYLAYSGTDTLGTLEIGVMTDPTVASTFVVVDTIDLSSLGYLEYEELMISMAAYTGDGKYVAFRSSNSIDCGYLIDDILLELRPDCMYPTNFTLVGVNSESVTVAWEEIGDATSWVVQCDLAGFTPGEGFFSDTVSTTTTTIMGLSNLTAYDIYVQSNCGDSQSEWVGPIPFTSGLYNMGILGEDTLTTCAAIICDDGGLYGDYSTMCDYTLVIYPDAVGNGLQITGTCNLHPGYSGFGTAHLYFFDGAGTNGNLIGDYTGDNANIVVAASGPITVNFVSDYYTASGFILNVECATCTPPSNIHLSDVSTDEATIAWNGIASLYAVTVTGATDLYTTTSDTSYTLIGLSSNSTYSVQVRSLCGTDSSIVYPALTFTTPCDALTITEGTPWTEDFEGYTGSGNQPFQCWTRTVVDPFYDAPFVYCGHALSCHSGANSAEFKGENGLLALPPFTNDVHDLRLSFWATSTDPSDGILEIGVLTDVMDPNSFEPVAVAGTPGPRDGVGNLMGPFVFDGVAATNGRIALRYSNPYGFDSWNLDDFIVDINPGCEAPTNLTISNITTSEAILNWDSPDLYASEWKLQYKAASATNWGPEIICSATTYYFVNLVPEATYQVRVKTVCDTAAESIWSEIANFTTESVIIIVDTCDVPTGLHTTNVENHTISIAWDANADVSNWNIQYRVLGESAFSSGTANTNSYTISDLAGLTTYEIQVQANCGDGNLSDWSDFITATTTNVGIGNWLDNSIVLFPNPANKYIDVRIDGDVNVALIEVYDVYGKLINNDQRG